MSKRKKITVRKNLRIGDLEAETDRALLSQCFIDNGALTVLIDVSTPESVIVGRTGSGKSALLMEIRNRVEHAVLLNPHDISVQYLEHSDIIQFLGELGVKLDIFYRLLWRHLIVVELLKLKYSLTSERRNLWDRIAELFDRDPVKREALAYFRDWGDKFWIETDQHLQEITQTLARNIEAGVGTDFGPLEFSARGAKNLSVEDRQEIVNRSKRVVSEIQIKKLAQVIDLLADKVFDDPHKKYFLLLDKMDEDWATTDTRLRFIRALIEEIKTFRNLEHVKILVAMRKDLLDLVFDRTRDSGFQQEKYESYIMPLTWRHKELYQLIEKRINVVFQSQYTSEEVHFQDVFPPPRKHGGGTAFDYLIERTLLRPRDIIQFVNECFASAAGTNELVSFRTIAAAEANYSDKRLKSLFEEWGDIYPYLSTTVELLRGLPTSFTRSDLEGDKFNRVISQFSEASTDSCVQVVNQYFDPKQSGISIADVLGEFISCFYRIGAIGVKTAASNTFVWADYDRATLSRGEIKRSTHMRVHKMLHRALGIQPNA